MQRLLQILSLKRAHLSEGEAEMIEAQIMPYNPDVFYDELGSVLGYVIEVGEGSETLFCAHTDTVHSSKEGKVNPVLFDEGLLLAYKEDGQPLGADDGAGVWLMLEMIDAEVPGVYLFPRGEEKGGIGSSGIAELYPDFLERFKYAIAFDRRGTKSVITYQSRGKCCSNEFAQALADMLNPGGLELAPDSTGIYTDTAEFVDLIPECTNISVGYDYEHSGKEMLDVEFLIKLRDALIERFDETQLPVVRKAGDLGEYHAMGWGSFGSRYRDYAVKGPRDERDIECMGFKELVDWVESADPYDVADLLQSMSDKLYEARQGQYYDDSRLSVGLM